MAEQEIKLLCGEGTLDLSLPESVPALEMKKLNALLDPEGAVYEALADPIMSQPLKEVARGRRNACIVISDFTRPVPNKIILPPLLKILEQSGMSKEKITILIDRHAQAKFGRRTRVPCGPGN